MKNSALYTSKTGVWETPQALFNKLNSVFGFTLDVCALPENTKCINYFTPEINGLNQSWSGNICWMNPPYGREISKWIEKAFLESSTGSCVVVALLPARTDTLWFHNYILSHNLNVEFIKGRLKFSNAKDPAPFPSMIVEFNFKKNKDARN